MEHLPPYIGAIFGLTTFVTIWLFRRAAPKSTLSVVIMLGWTVVVGAVGLTGFFTMTDTLPPRFILVVGPPLLFIVGLFATRQGRAFVSELDLKALTWLHVVRVPVELVLFWLAEHKQVPQLMTFEGRNWDILSGLTAPIIVWLYFNQKRIGEKGLLLWNFICLGLLVNIVGNAVLSVPSPFQRFAFEQPNVGVLYFPFVWLPGIVVPLVLLSHLAAIRRLFFSKPTKNNASPNTQ
ncbi:MAG: hypothetical protein KF734_09625 [Saprospiraceae bacterium]|nr:hypothetical protein [Saprospiraceae bacterium]